MNERRIATVLRVRSLRERIARGEVAQSRLRLDERRRDEAAAWETVRDRSRLAPRGSHQFVGHRAMLHAGVMDAASAGHRVDAAATDVASAMAHWQDAARRLDGIERLAERTRLEAQAEQQRLDGKELDDLVVMRRKPAPQSIRPVGARGGAA